MNKRVYLLLFTVAVQALPVLPSRAQVVADGATNTLNNVTNTFTGNVTVGTNGSFTLLTLSNNALLTNSLDGRIGLNSSASSNEVRLISPSARWQLGGSLNVGVNGTGNYLVVSNGAAVYDVGSTFIGSNVNANANAITATGPGSRLLLGSSFLIGAYGAMNQLTISNGAVVTNLVAVLGQNFASSNNTAIVTGLGSTWSNSGPLQVGGIGRGNQLLIADGANVRDAASNLGISSSSSNNQATVTGPGSTWSHAGSFYVGLGSVGNQLVVSNGGFVGNNVGVVGIGIGANSNVAVVTGSGSVWSNASIFNVGSEGAGNRLIVSNGGAVWDSTGTVGLLAGDNAALVTGAGTRWTNSQNLFIGSSASRNQLVVSNGATVFTGGDGYLGYNLGATSNSVILTDAGTRWLLNSDLYVGSNGAMSGLMITNGAYMENEYVTIGSSISSSNNEVVVTGIGSSWTNHQVLFLGESGRENRLLVGGGAKLQSNLGYVGVNTSSSNNQAILTGAGTLWEIRNSLVFGSQSSGNRLVISNGAAMFTDGAYVGASNACSNNLAVITGAASGWTNTGPLYVGYFSPANQLLITNGGMLVSSQGITIGANSLSLGNRLVVDGGTLLLTGDSLNVGWGTNVLNAGLMMLKQLLLTNPPGYFEFNGGTLRASGITNSNGRIFTVGNGASPAELQLQGGTHIFANSLSVANNAMLTGNGTVVGTVNMLPGTTLAPGISVGKLILNNSPVLLGKTLMEISRSGTALTNDQLQINAVMIYAGSLMVTNIGPTPLVAGDRFKLFTSGTYLGSFSSVTLPPLGFNLIWTNKLAVDGSIEVVSGPVPQFTSVTRSDTNLILSGVGGTLGESYAVLTTTNVTQPLGLWTSIATNQFGSGGGFAFTNAINPGTPQRYFRVRWP